MKRLILIALALVCARATPLRAQVSNQLTGAGAPSGSCTSTQQYLDTTNHVLYYCNNNAWSASQGLGNLTGGGSGTVSGQSNNVIPKGTTATTITQQSSCTDNGTTFSCTEPVASTGALTAGTGCTPAGATATGGVCMTEAASTGWTPTAGFSYMRADSATHLLKCSTNGGAEGSCSSSLLSSIAAAVGANTIANGNNPQTWNWAQTTNAQTGFALGETSAATNGTLTSGLANQVLFGLSTQSASTSTPFSVTQGSITGTVAFPAFQVQTTWNNASLVGEGLLFNLTNTSSQCTGGGCGAILDLRVANASVFTVGPTGVLSFRGSSSATTSSPPNASGNGSVTNSWGYCFGNQINCVGIGANATEYHLLNGGGARAWFSLGNSFSLAGAASGASPDANTSFSLYDNSLTMIGKEEATSCSGVTNISGQDEICADATSHEFLAATNGATSLGMLVRRQPGAINQTAQTAAITTATLCAASAGACNVAGQYNIHIDVWGSGTACGTPSPGGVTPSLTWTDENAVAHSAVVIPMMSQTGATTTAVNVTAPTVAFQSALANEGGSGDFTISTNGTVIQYAVAYAACGAGTGTYNIRITVTRLA